MATDCDPMMCVECNWPLEPCREMTASDRTDKAWKTLESIAAQPADTPVLGKSDTMQVALAAIDRMIDSFDRANQALEQVWPILQSQDGLNGQIAEAITCITELDDRRAADITELREGLAALSNRLEGLTRVVMDGGEHYSVKVP